VFSIPKMIPIFFISTPQKDCHPERSEGPASFFFSLLPGEVNRQLTRSKDLVFRSSVPQSFS
jgi:hypothetical protein